MTQNGKIVKIENSKTFVLIKRQSACSGNCKSCDGCDEKPIICEAQNDINAKIGDDVIVFSDTKKILSLAFKLYIVPIIFLILTLGIYESVKFSKLLLTAILLVLGIIWILILKTSKTPKRTILEVTN